MARRSYTASTAVQPICAELVLDHAGGLSPRFPSGAHQQCRLQATCNSISAASSWILCTSTISTAHRYLTKCGEVSSNFSIGWRTTGIGPTRVSGKCAAGAAISHTPKCNAGSLWTGACGWRGERPALPVFGKPWECERDRIYHAIMDQSWNAEIGAFTQCFHSDALDASTLLMPLMRFVSGTDPRMVATLEQIRLQLAEDSLVLRYEIGKAARDGLPGHEGFFTACSFWLVEAMAGAGPGGRSPTALRKNALFHQSSRVSIRRKSVPEASY